MITEDFVSFETAELLKEKGFNEPCYAYWHEDENKLIISQSMHALQNVTNPCFFGPAAPTIQMAMKWLREIYGLNIQVCIVKTIESKKAYNATIYSNDCEQLKAYFGRNIFDGFNSYEEAAEEAIKYCLINLI